MNNIDVKETSKLSNSLLYQASQPVKKPAVIEEEEGSDEKDTTFLTTGGDSAATASHSNGVGRRVSKATIGEDVSPQLARLQKVLHVEMEEVKEEEQHAGRKHFSGRRNSTDYFQNPVANSRPQTAPAQEFPQENELDAQDMKHMNRHERRTLLASATTSSMHAINAARNLLRRSSSTNVMTQKERPKSAVIALNFSSEEEDEEEVMEFDMDKDGGSDDNNDNDHNNNDVDDDAASEDKGWVSPKRRAGVLVTVPHLSLHEFDFIF